MPESLRFGVLLVNDDVEGARTSRRDEPPDGCCNRSSKPSAAALRRDEEKPKAPLINRGIPADEFDQGKKVTIPTVPGNPEHDLVVAMLAGGDIVE